jgi:hypothetical protein
MGLEYPIQINSEEELNALYHQRYAKDLRKAERGDQELQDKLQEALARADAAERRAYDRLLERDARGLLTEMGVDPARHDRLLKMVDLQDVPPTASGDPDRRSLTQRVKALHRDLPEVFGSEATVQDHGLDSSVRTDTEAEISEERIRNMSAEEINSNWDSIWGWMKGTA